MGEKTENLRVNEDGRDREVTLGVRPVAWGVLLWLGKGGALGGWLPYVLPFTHLDSRSIYATDKNLNQNGPLIFTLLLCEPVNQVLTVMTVKFY
jgi:hypothetical protein